MFKHAGLGKFFKRDGFVIDGMNKISKLTDCDVETWLATDAPEVFRVVMALWVHRRAIHVGTIFAGDKASCVQRIEKFWHYTPNNRIEAEALFLDLPVDDFEDSKASWDEYIDCDDYGFDVTLFGGPETTDCQVWIKLWQNEAEEGNGPIFESSYQECRSRYREIIANPPTFEEFDELLRDFEPPVYIATQRATIAQPSERWTHKLDVKTIEIVGDLPDYMPQDFIEIPMTLVLPSGFERDQVARLIDELQSGEQGLDLGGWGRLHVGWNCEKAVLI